ncbi:MAG: penicillin-binding protein 1C [Flavobacteriaceae bacterium]|nr:MAG: penicillin-binding protein 1C [Flavobacteriaceae bacterium]
MIWYAFCLPEKLFRESTSTVILSREDKLLGAKIAKDGQWRFPENAQVPKKFRHCLIHFEDEYFYWHPGFNPISIIKALIENAKQREIKRGGSTITQQVIRLSRKEFDRTYMEKLKEIILATRLEFRASKEKIISLWANNAPFGGNIVGLDAASWRYFNRSAGDLSWAESATLAILPNAPSLMYPGKNQEKLLKKRNQLLKKLLRNSIIDSLTYQLSIQEKLPSKPYAIPQIAPHLLQKISKKKEGKVVKTTIDYYLQKQVNQIVKAHYEKLSQNEIYNAAILILDVKTRQVFTYIGNTPTTSEHQKDVDIIDKPRSTGSILKPFLYGAMLDDGIILPETLIPDTPTQIGTYQPENFNRDFAGAVSAKKALARSLNVPAVKMLQEFGLHKFHHYLQELNFHDINQPPDHYGLTLILGGAESNLWDLCKNYAAFSSTINHYNETLGYYSNEFCEPTYIFDEKMNPGKIKQEKNLINAASIYLTFESLKEVYRPGANQNWEYFDSSKEIAWKTGTSFGYRDAWAIGTSKDYVVGVWVGNADGEGRPGLIGIQTAAPILFEVFDKLPKSRWFDMPLNEMVTEEVCSKSGYRATELCEEKISADVSITGLHSKPCPYHKIVHLNKTGEYLVNTSCEKATDIVQKSWFILPPVMEYYYKKKNPFYQQLPDFKNSCLRVNEKLMAFIYPKNQNKIYLPKDFNGQRNDVVLKVTHSDENAVLFWYIDGHYQGKTTKFHELGIQPKEGSYVITVVDHLGNELKKKIKITL